MLTSLNLRRSLIGSALLLAICVASPSLFANDALISKGRELFNKHSDAVVSIAGNLSLDISMMGQQEQPISVLGTVIDASGLVLTSNTAMNPIGDEEVTVEPQPGMELSITAKLGDLWIDLPGGERISVEPVLIDPLHDVAILRPKDAEKAAELGKRALNSSPATTAPEVLEPLIVLGRTGEMSNRVPTVDIVHARAKVETPRPCTMISAPVGSPVFNGSGALIGIVTTLSSGEEFDPMMMMGGGGAGGAPVVNPWSALKPIIDQAQQKTETKAAEGL